MEKKKDLRDVPFLSFGILTICLFSFSMLPPSPIFTQLVALDQVERWNRRDQKLLEAVQRGDVGRVAALASRKSARPTKLDSNGQSP